MATLQHSDVRVEFVEGYIKYPILSVYMFRHKTKNAQDMAVFCHKSLMHHDW